MIIEIRQAGFVNKGAELMLNAIVQQLNIRYPEAKLTMAPVFGASEDTFEKMRQLNIYPKAWLWRKGIDFGQLAEYFPRKKLLKTYGLVFDSEVDVVIDAAGFSYSDQWGVSSSKELSSSSKRWKKRNTKLILLPQAFGPYESDNIKKYVKDWCLNADLIFAREIDSYNHLANLVGKQEKIKIYPDFTNIVPGTLPKNYNNADKEIALIPNHRMLDKTNKKESDAYVPFMIMCAKYLLLKNKKPFILVHEGEADFKLAKTISDAVGGLPIVKETNALHIKGIIGSCEATIGSRFHGLVSALSQAIPSLATGWSHKYERLFEDYGFTEGFVNVLDSEEIIYKKIDMLIEPRIALPIRKQLLARSNELKLLTEEMWEMVFTEIDSISY